MQKFYFELKHKHNKARAGIIHTAHGDIHTPIFMPVGTQATIKGLTKEHIQSTNAEIILGNTYHLMLRPTAEIIHKMGGLHKFMNWEKPILTDSGGFQVMSLSAIRKVKEEGVKFQSHIDGSTHLLTPERSMEIQYLLDADITMAFDECTAYGSNEKKIKNAMYRSLRWAERCKKAFVHRDGYGLFGIMQGGDNKDWRELCANELIKMNFDGYAIGGMVGYNVELFKILDYALDFLPEEKPRYVMGIGKPIDIVGAVARGMDMCDCVLPARYGRHGIVFTRKGELKMREVKYELDDKPLDEECSCLACRMHTRSYIHHLFKAEETLGGTLMTIHNLTYYLDLTRYCREQILKNAFDFNEVCQKFCIK